MGGSFTPLTVMATRSESLRAPPAPLLPWSSVIISTLALPLKFGVGSNTNPSRALLISVIVPVKVTLAVPSAPPVMVNPLMPLRLSAPLTAFRVTRRVPAPASTSPMEIGLLVTAENTRAVSSLVDCATGTLLIGASLSGSTVMVTVATFEGAVPSSTM